MSPAAFEDAPSPLSPSLSRGVSGEALSVSAASDLINRCVHGLPRLRIIGEVTGFRGPNQAGHCYFDIKDDTAVLSCIVWRGIYTHLPFEITNGMLLDATGIFDVYKGSGKLSFQMKQLAPVGEGALRAQVAALAERLKAEGLMDEAHKRPIPRFCRVVAVVTSPTGSVIDDVKRTLYRRNPSVKLLISPAQVQGSGAVESLINALSRAASAGPDCIMLVRGGGSYEDLMAFNDEALARAVASCSVPVVTGIGHEPDTSICDMVADRRCSTPTAAAESVAPELDKVLEYLDDRSHRLILAFKRAIDACRGRTEASVLTLASVMRGKLTRERVYLEACADRPCLADPRPIFDAKAAAIENARSRLLDAWSALFEGFSDELKHSSEYIDAMICSMLERCQVSFVHSSQQFRSAGLRLIAPYRALLARRTSVLEALSPLKVVSRGYAIARTREQRIISRVASVAEGDRIDILFADGTAQTTVVHIAGPDAILKTSADLFNKRYDGDHNEDDRAVPPDSLND